MLRFERYAGLPLLSLSLPVKKRPYGEEKTASWFNGLLPEGARRDSAARSLGVAVHDWIGLIAGIGWECAGAVSIYERGSRVKDQGSYERLTLDMLRDKLSDLTGELPRPQDPHFRMSLGGFQEKMCIAMPRLSESAGNADLSHAYLPLFGAPSTHILKPENARDYPGCAQSEAWAMEVARHAARCSDTTLLQIDDMPDTLVAERYDRAGLRWPDDVARLHQEDACQALGLPPSRKYANAREAKGDDPTFGALASLLNRHAMDPEGELCELLRQLVVNLAVGNWDAHAKNTSLLYTKRFSPSVAPMYDVVPVAEVEPRTRVLSMRVSGHILPEEVGKRELIDEARSWGLEEGIACRVVEKCLVDLEAGIDSAARMYPDAASRHEDATLKRMTNLGR